MFQYCFSCFSRVSIVIQNMIDHLDFLISFKEGNLFSLMDPKLYFTKWSSLELRCIGFFGSTNAPHPTGIISLHYVWIRSLGLSSRHHAFTFLNLKLLGLEVWPLDSRYIGAQLEPCLGKLVCITFGWSVTHFGLTKNRSNCTLVGST